MAKQIGIDLGTTNVLVYVRGRGIVLNEPSVVAVHAGERTIRAVGDEAREMLGRAPDSVVVYRPMRSGVIAHYSVTEAMLAYFLQKVAGRWRIFQPDVMICIPCGATGVESRAVRDAALQAGAKNAYLIPEPLAAALGANVPIDGPDGNLIIDIGGGTTEVAVISLYGIAVKSSIRVGGNKLDDAIAAYIKREYNLMIGERAAEEVKIQVASAIPLERDLECDVRGRDQVLGMPRSITVRTTEIREAIAEPVGQIVEAVKWVLERTPPELASDIFNKGMVMTGGGALLRGLDALMTQVTEIPCHVAENPLNCVVLGTGKALEELAYIRRSLVQV
jgi:rod shape-determining protein MreB and related proteins